MDQDLYKSIENSTAHRPSRDFNSNLIFENLELLPDLMAIVLDVKDKNYHKACWILELVYEKQIDRISPYLDIFCETLSSYSHDGAVRSISKICMFSAHNYIQKQKSGECFLTEKQLELMVEACFDWLISDMKVASKAYSMRALFEFGKVKDWIYPELKVILTQDYANHTAAYKAACKDILKRIK